MKHVIKLMLLAGLLMIQPNARAEEGGEDRAAGLSLTLDADIPGGAGVLERVYLVEHVDASIPEKVGLPQWWYFRLGGITPGELIQVNMKSNRATPVYSLDNRNWRFAGNPTRIDGAEAWFAWYVPYTLSNALSLAKHVESASDAAKGFTLATTREGNPVPAIRINAGEQAGSNRKVVWIQARQHASESGSSWVAAGFAEWLVSNDAVAERLRQDCEVVIVPIMDVDSVQKGAGGREQRPHDHDRDWTASPHWPSVKAAQNMLKQFIEDGRLALFLDLHNPNAKRMNGLEFWWLHDGEKSALQTQHLDVFQRIIREQLKMLPGRIGKGRYVRASDDESRVSSKWVTLHAPDSVLAFSLEIQLPPPRGYAGNPPDYHLAAGAELGRALAQYVRETKQITGE
jgi:hypothetical protein